MNNQENIDQFVQQFGTSGSVHISTDEIPEPLQELYTPPQPDPHVRFWMDVHHILDQVRAWLNKAR